MGVSGAGKTTAGHLLAEALGYSFAEGDSFHDPANIVKMRGGIPLTDADRWPWLRRLGDEIGGWIDAGEGMVLTCSALKRSYRRVLVGGRIETRLVYLKGSKDMIRERLARRVGHYMPAALLDSQFSALEEPESEESAVVVDIGPPPEIIAEAIRRHLEDSRRQPG